MTLDEAIEYGKNLQEDANIMLDEEKNVYHVIRLFGVNHWLQHYKNIAEIRVEVKVKML